MNDIRIWFKKDGAARYISHLDLNRCMIRAINRAKIPIWHTEGFNPHPFITFALPLSLGMRGEAESMDVRLVSDMDFTEIAERMNKTLPEGIFVYDVTSPKMKPGEISYALFEMKLSADELPVPELFKKVNELFAMSEIMVDKKSKSGIKEVDLKENICKFEITCDDNKVIIELTLPAGSTTNVNPNLILTALSKYFQIDAYADITRKEIYNKDVERFE